MLQVIKLAMQLAFYWLAMMALIPISIIVLVAVIGTKKIKPDNNHYEGNEEEIEEMLPLKFDDIDYDNEVNINLN